MNIEIGEHRTHRLSMWKNVTHTVEIVEPNLNGVEETKKSFFCFAQWYVGGKRQTAGPIGAYCGRPSCIGESVLRPPSPSGQIYIRKFERLRTFSIKTGKSVGRVKRVIRSGFPPNSTRAYTIDVHFVSGAIDFLKGFISHLCYVVCVLEMWQINFELVPTKLDTCNDSIMLFWSTSKMIIPFIKNQKFSTP